MITLLLRTAIVYLLVFSIVRLMGKRQISDMQPFDLVITLLIADLASAPISDCGIPLLYGIIPILTLFIMHRAVAFLALRSQRIRSLVCGHPIVVIDKGTVVEEAMRAANYSINDLMEQLRVQQVFSLSDVRYAILETNGSLSVLQNETAVGSTDEPAVLLLSDGKPQNKSLDMIGKDEEWLCEKLSEMGGAKPADCLFVFLEKNVLHLQTKTKNSSEAVTLYAAFGE